MPTAAKIAQQNANPSRVGQVSTSAPTRAGSGGTPPLTQVNGTGSFFWSMGSPLVAGMNPHPYPDSE